MTSEPGPPKILAPRGLPESASFLSQIIGSVAVVISLIYVGLQLQQNTAQLQRGENNATETQFQAIRLFIAGNPDVADLVVNGLYGRADLSPSDEFRLETLLSEYTWSTFHIWDRTRRGLLDKDEFERGGAPGLARMLCTRRGGGWWAKARFQFVAGFVKDVDTAIDAVPDDRCPDYAEPPVSTANG